MATRTRKPAALPGKLLAPRLGRVFDRERLFERLDASADAPGLWVAAAPGAGKSTLVATWLQRREGHTLWLQLDPGDADPATFVQSLDTLLGSATDGRVELPTFHTDDLSDPAGWLRRRLRLFAPHLPAQWVLVFDNHQDLPAASPLHAALAQALAELPRGAQWVFISRENPPRDYARALAQQQLVVLATDSLRFDEHETLTLTRLHGRPDSMAAALASAQGWAGGLTLMLLGSPPQASLPGFEASQRLFDYFAGEVLARMSAAEQDALCRIALLPGATAELAVAQSGNAEAGELLQRLAGLSLFTDRREGQPTVYVFHALFSEFLRKRLESALPAQEWRAIQLRAGQLLQAAGQVDAGLQRMIDSECWAEATAALQRAAPQHVAQGRTLALSRFIDRLPPDWRAPLAYWRGYCALDADPAQALLELQQAHAASTAAADADAQLASAAALATALVSTGRLNELDACINTLDHHAARAGVVQPEAVEMRWVPGLLAAVVYRAPWHPLADKLAERAERLLHRDAAPGQRLLLASLAFHLLWRGHVDRLERIVSRIDALCAQPLSAPATLMRWWRVGILVKTLLGQTESARADAERALALLDSEPSVASERAGVELLRMIVALGAGDAATAKQCMHNAAQALHPDNAVDRATYEHQRGILALLDDDRPAALRLMRASVASAQAGGFPMREHIALIANALAATQSGEHAEAEQRVAQMFEHPFYAIRGWHHWVAGVVAAHVALQRHDEPAALQRLSHALEVARACGFRHGPMLYCCGDMMPRLAALALNHGIEPDIARDLVLRNNLPAPETAGASWPWAVKLHALGGLLVERADGPMPNSRKESRRLLDVLRLLVAHGESPLPLDALADQLWPDADGDAARNALDNALHRLRKWLGGDDRILLRQGALSLNPQRCWTDVATLQRLLVQLDTGAPEATLPLARQVRTLYAAPLLRGVELPGVVRCRQALHQGVARSLTGAAERLAVAGLVEAAATAREIRDSLESLPNL